MDKIFAVISAAIVAYAFGTMCEMIVQGTLLYAPSHSLSYQLIYSAVLFVVIAAAMLKTAAKKA